MYDFERDLVGEIPMAAAAEFFVEVKNFGDPGGDLKMYKAAAVRMNSKAQEIIADLLEGRMPEGKAGHFKTAQVEDIPWHERYRPMAGYTAGAALGGAGTLGLAKALKGKAKLLAIPASIPLTLGGGTLGALAAVESLPKRKLMAMTEGIERELPSHQRQGVLRQRARVMRELEKESSPRTEKERITGAAAGGLGAGLGYTAGATGYKTHRSLIGKGVERAKALGMSPESVEAGRQAAKKFFKTPTGKAMKWGTMKTHFKGSLPVAAGVGLLTGGSLYALRKPKKKTAEARFRMAFWKMAQGPAPEGTMPQPSDEVMTPSPAPPSPPQEPTSPPLEVPTTEPMNYIGAELAGRQLQDVNESGFYRERLGQTTAENQQLQQQVQQLSQMAQQAQTQAAATAAQMQVSQQEAVDANQRALQHSQEAANMRMGMQKLREQMFQIAAQEPETVLEQAQSAVAQEQDATAQQQQVPSPGIPGGRVPPSQPGAAVPPGGAGQQVPAASSESAKEETEAVKAQQEAVKQTGQAEAAKAKDQAKGQTNVQVKTSGAASYVGKELAKRAPYAAGGALLGIGEAEYKSRQLPLLKQRVQDLEAASGQGGFSQAVDLAQAKAQLDMAQLYKKHPGRMMAGRAAVGGLAGGLLGPEIMSMAKGLRKSMAKAKAI